MSAKIPEGYVSVGEDETFLGHIGGLYWRFSADGAESCLVVERRHTNPMGVAHGGLVMTLLDVTLGAAAHTHVPPGTFPLTLQSSCSFIRGAREGVLLHCTARADSVTKSLLYISGRAYVADGVVATSSALYRTPSTKPAVS